MKTWIWNAAAIGTIAALTLLLPPLVTREQRSRLAPYRFAVTEKPDDEVDLDFLRDRIARAPSGLDLAALSGTCLKKARRTGQSRWIDDARDAARRSLEILPVSNPGAILALAHAAQMTHEFEESLSLCGQVLRDRPRDPRALSLQATALLGLGRLTEALGSADALIDRSPISEHLALRAVILSARGDDREALHDFTQAALREEPGDSDGSAWLRAMWARHCLRLGALDDAEDLLREALRIRPVDGPALGLLGDLRLRRGDAPAADRAYAAAYQATGDPVFLARRARARGGDPDLRAAAEKALRESPGHGLQLAQVLLDRGDPDAVAEAVAVAEAEAQNRRHAETLETLARALLAAGRPRDARPVVREALRSGTRTASLEALSGDIEERLGCASRAAMHREAARALQP